MLEEQVYFLLGAIGVALILDLAFIRWLRQSKTSAGENTNDRVYVAGVYSPMLTWIKNFATALSQIRSLDDVKRLFAHILNWFKQRGFQFVGMNKRLLTAVTDFMAADSNAD